MALEKASNSLHNVQSYTNGPQVTAARPTLHSFIAEHDRLLVSLHDAVTDLSSRMTPIMSPRPEQGGGGDKHPGSAYSDLAREMERQNYALSEAISRIRDLSENIDL